MPTTPPPKITEQEYVVVRAWIEAGCAQYEYWQKNGAWPDATPDIATLAKRVAAYTGSNLPLSGEENALCVAWDVAHPDQEGRLPPELVRGDVVFRDRKELITLINVLAPEAAAAVKKRAGEDTDEWGIEAWAVALVAGGVLVAIGAFTFAGAAIVTVVGYLFLGLAAALVITAATPAGKKLIKDIIEAAGKVATEVGKKASQLVTGLIIAGGVALGVGLTVYAVRVASSRRRALTR